MVSFYKWSFLPVSVVVIMIFLLYSFPDKNILHDNAKEMIDREDLEGQNNKGHASKIIHKSKTKGSKYNHYEKSKYVARNEAIRNVFKDSLATIQTTCKKYRSQNRTKNYELPDIKNFSLEPKHKLIICRTAKHGSTSWAHNLVQIYQKNKKAEGTQLKLRKLENKFFSSNEKVKIVESLLHPMHEYLAFFVCRDPLEKLLSVHKYLLDLRQKKSPGVFARPGRKDFAGLRPPSWPQFLHLVAVSKERSYLGLLEPNYQHCDPCNIQYDAVIKMEHFGRDSERVLSAAGIKWLKTSHENSHGNQSLKRKTIFKMFEKTSKSDIKEIVKKFRKDFELCGYKDTLDTLEEVIKQRK